MLSLGACSRREAFQSSPALKDRCNPVGRDVLQRSLWFQSSPALKDRCNGKALEVLDIVVRFNPHRP